MEMTATKLRICVEARRLAGIWRIYLSHKPHYAMYGSASEPRSTERVSQSKDPSSEENNESSIERAPNGPKSDSPEEEEGQAYKNPTTGEIGGPKGPEPTRYGDWEKGGRCYDF
ncbi:hypothetical protein KP509_25G075800 [Ceratopteris richardii]|uniref:Succinate dehydrogenase assembly factor 4, mitochondrial n=1 Tax=Ceratopteris richardii TaxID=49495 RepID=A0A8T2RRS0_CERRI|nr:hypothetical protein KP509_25G075800 [Ceratopteris richardii]